MSQLVKTGKCLKAAQDSQQQQSSLELVANRSGKRLTSESLIARGIRRNLTHIAASDVGAILLRDLSASTVLRAEVRTGASVNACMNEFVDNPWAELRLPAAEQNDDEADADAADNGDISDIIRRRAASHVHQRSH